MPKEPGLTHYLAKAFTWRWNLLAFPAALIVAVISPLPGIAVPIVLAAEVGYLGFLGTNPKFQKAIAAADNKENKQKELPPARSKLDIALDNLDRNRKERFTSLRERCMEMSRLAAKVRGDTHRDETDLLHLASLDRMLWVFLRLLASQQALQKFLRTTDSDGMERRVSELDDKIKFAKAQGNEKILRSLTASLATAQLRLDNYDKAKENAQFVDIELDRIEDQIQALVEMSVGHEDPDFISSQVDSVAASVSDTEAVMRDMSFVPGVEDFEQDETPAILSIAQ